IWVRPLYWRWYWGSTVTSASGCSLRSCPAQLRLAGQLPQLGGVAVEGAQPFDHLRVENIAEAAPVVVQERSRQIVVLAEVLRQAGLILIEELAGIDQQFVKFMQRCWCPPGCLPDRERERKSRRTVPDLTQIE